MHNVFIDNRGFPNQLDEFDTLLHNIDGGPVLRKLKHPPPYLDMTDPLFSFSYDELLHSKCLYRYLDLSYLATTLQQIIYALIKKYRLVFDNCGMFVLVKNYKCVIDTGGMQLITVKNIQYGPKEIPKLHKAIAALESVGHSCQIHDGQWLFKAVLAPKPHQEHMKHIKDFIWRFYINYIPLNSFTWIIAYPIPCCDSAVLEEFGMGLWLWLYDALSGYHQLAVTLASQEKLAFQGPNAIK